MLRKREFVQLRELLQKLIPIRGDLPQELFDVLAKIAPFIALEMVVMNRQGEMLLTWREDQYWKGWHFPGGLLRYGESFEKRLQKTAQRELGVSVQVQNFLFPLNYGVGPRSHDVSLVFLCAVAATPKAGRFFKKMPRGIIKSHRAIWKKIRKPSS